MMSIFYKKPKELKFSTRAEAFNYMLSFLVEEKNVPPLDAAKQANEFAEIFATNMGLPLVIIFVQVYLLLFLTSINNVIS